MRTYDEILDIAAARKGGRVAVLDDVPTVLDADELAAIPDDRWLAQMARGIFQAGISWTVVETKWPGIEDAFHRFDIGRCAFMAEDWFEALMSDPRIIRSAPKVRAVQENATLIQRVSAEHGSFGRWVGDWSSREFATLLEVLKKDGSRLGGNTGAYALRMMGRDSYLMSGSVVARLIAEGIVDKAPSSKKAWGAVQEAFNTWMDQSGQGLTVVSRVLAQSADG